MVSFGGRRFCFRENQNYLVQCSPVAGASCILRNPDQGQEGVSALHSRGRGCIWAFDPSQLNCCVWCELGIKAHHSRDHPVTPALFVTRLSFPSLSFSGAIVKNQCTEQEGVCFQTRFHWSLRLHGLHDSRLLSFIESLEVRKYKSSNFVLLFQNCFGYPDLLLLHISFKSACQFAPPKKTC